MTHHFARRAGWRLFLLVLGGIAGALGGPVAVAQQPLRHGIVPEGFWVLNQARSHKMNPGEQTLWIVKDDGDHVVWVSVERDAHNMVRISSWDGRYDDQPTEVKGTGMMTHLSSRAPGTLHNWGDIPGLGRYTEDCTILDGGKRMRCEGAVAAADGTKHYVDDFDWRGKGFN